MTKHSDWLKEQMEDVDRTVASWPKWMQQMVLDRIERLEKAAEDEREENSKRKKKC